MGVGREKNVKGGYYIAVTGVLTIPDAGCPSCLGEFLAAEQEGQRQDRREEKGENGLRFLIRERILVVVGIAAF